MRSFSTAVLNTQHASGRAVMDDILDACTFVSDNPLSGITIDPAFPNLRKFHCKRCVLIYRYPKLKFLDVWLDERLDAQNTFSADAFARRMNSKKAFLVRWLGMEWPF